MQASATLELFALLSIAFAGFSGLAVVVRGASIEPSEASHQRALGFLVECSVCTLAYSVLPLVLWNLGLPESAVWRVAAVVFSFASGVYYYFRFTELLVDAVTDERIRSFRLTVALHAVIIVSMVGSAFRAIDVDSITIYFIGLLWNLISIGMTFAWLVRPISGRR
jgi:hypothetical protein